MPISKPNGLFGLQLVIIYISVILKPTKRKTIKIYTESYLKNPRLFFKAYLLHTSPLYSMSI